MQRKCYFGCKINGPLHSFPSPDHPHAKRFSQWKAILGEDAKNRGNAFIYGNIRICGQHFEHFYKTRGNRLTNNSVPTLNLSIMQTQENDITDIPQSPQAAKSLCSVSPQKARSDEPVCKAIVITKENIFTDYPQFPQAAKSLSSVSLQQARSAEPVRKAIVKTQEIVVTDNPQSPQAAKSLCSVSPQQARNAEPVRKALCSTKNRRCHCNEVSKLKVKLKKMVTKCKILTQKLREARKISQHKSFLKAVENFPVVFVYKNAAEIEKKV